MIKNNKITPMKLEETHQSKVKVAVTMDYENIKGLTYVIIG